MTTKVTSSLKILEKACGAPITMSTLLESLRKCDEFSQSAYAKKLGISRTHLCDIEKGRKFVSPVRAAHFAKILGMSEMLFVRVAIQDMLNVSGLKFLAELKAA